MAIVEGKIKAENNNVELKWWSMNYTWDLLLDEADIFLPNLMVAGQITADWDQGQKSEFFNNSVSWVIS